MAKQRSGQIAREFIDNFSTGNVTWSCPTEPELVNAQYVQLVLMREIADSLAEIAHSLQRIDDDLVNLPRR